MRTKKDIFADGTISFTPNELIDFEHTIKDSIAEFLPFTSYSLFSHGKNRQPSRTRNFGPRTRNSFFHLFFKEKCSAIS